MTIFEFAVTYAVCWWMVLFMVLPHQAQAAAEPEVGHARSAPAKPQIRKKMRWATLFAFLPAIALYFVVNAAKAEEIYHVGSRCKPLSVHQPRADVAAKDGYATGGKTVKPATIGGDNPYVQDHYDMSLRVPTDPYLKPAPGQKSDLTDSFIGAGDISISKDGTATLNGMAIAPQETYLEGCADAGENQ